MNKAELNSVFEWMEPSDNQKEKMFQHIIQTNDVVKSKKHTASNHFLKIAAMILLALSLTGATAYASGLHEKIFGGYFSIENNYISWSTHDNLLTDRNDTNASITTKEYDEVFTYDTIEEALQKHELKIAIPNNKLLSHNSYKPSVKTNNENSDITEINFCQTFDLSDGTVELNVNCYIRHTNTKDIFGMSTSVQSDNAKTSNYVSKSSAKYTLLESNYKGQNQSCANIMINTEDNQIYFYSILFTNVTQTDIEAVLDSFDMSIYVSE